jgi:hypothetical protein
LRKREGKGGVKTAPELFLPRLGCESDLHVKLQVVDRSSKRSLRAEDALPAWPAHPDAVEGETTDGGLEPVNAVVGRRLKTNKDELA